MIRTFIAALALAVGTAQSQLPASFERLGALRHAIATGAIELPPGTVIMKETVADSANPRPVFTRLEYRESDARALAAEVSEQARIGSTAEHLECANRRCWSTSPTPVLLLSDPDHTMGYVSVLIRLYTRDSEGGVLTQCVVRVERRGEEWVGYQVSGPDRLRVIIPPTEQ